MIICVVGHAEDAEMVDFMKSARDVVREFSSVAMNVKVSVAVPVHPAKNLVVTAASITGVCHFAVKAAYLVPNHVCGSVDIRGVKQNVEKTVIVRCAMNLVNYNSSVDICA